MKKLLFLILLRFIPVITFAQLHTSVGLGYDAQKVHGIASWDVGYSKVGINLDGEIKPSMTRNPYVNNYMGIKLGYDVLNEDIKIIPSVGYYYNLVSEDKIKQNHNYMGYSVKAILMIKHEAGMFADVMEINKSWQTLIGIYFQFLPRHYK